MTQTLRDVVFLHGWGSNAQVFRGLARAREKRFNVHTFELPGYGDAPPCTPYTLERIADTLAAKAPTRCGVVGWSLGAQVALAWARRAPQQVEKLALIAATPCFVQRGDWPNATEKSVLRQFAQALKRDRTGVLLRFVSLQTLGDAHAAKVAHRLRNVLFARVVPPVSVLEHGLEILRTTDMREELGAIKQPVLVLHGDHDAVTPPAAGQWLAHALPNARFHAFQGAGHAPFISQPANVSRVLAEFFDE
jgi:pimeloyl-[acyl-carrier protein] methyl ester esterase